MVIGACLIGASFYAGTQTSSNKSTDQKDARSDYPLLAKRLFIDNPNDVIINFAPLRETVRRYVDQNNIKGSVYFEYLPTGTSVRVDGDDEYVAASLMKIPVVMELYKEAEMGKINLDKKIALKNEWLDAGFGDLYKKGVGYEISLRDAAKLALTKSDNTAISMILYNTRNVLTLQDNVISSLDISFDRDDTSQIAISARSYASFLKCLYFSCYVGYESSQEILQFLSESMFKNRLEAGVPDQVKIAHKIGTYSNTTQSDCGIIYEDKRNYLLCVMLQVPDNEAGNAHIAAISKIVYDYIKDTEPKR